MPRTARASAGGICYHVLNRGNGQAEVFHKDGDFAAFLDLMAAANERLPLRVLGYVLMPNHFHLVLWPRGPKRGHSGSVENRRLLARLLAGSAA
jgi:putative transposase